ncbi:MAG: bifunctional glutamate N-acetyltransferase/amino-acid acetyltransferase ArgJ [Lentisphaerae bacterium]|nr:bifunctional glutamate N-acetyltransferase/amino-acid acetyltransferase ArgJ [Lentisphaerota bacterium]
MVDLEGGVTAAKGYSAAGIHAGIKKSSKDLAIVVSNPPAAVAGVFTTNRVQGATVKLCRERLRGGKASAIVINSGCANACTGARGIADAGRMAAVTASALKTAESTVFVCSTGTIGIFLPMDVIEKGIAKAAGLVSAQGGDDASEAIMTTDTGPKRAAVEFTAGGVKSRLGGMAKGAGMIEPKMATMLSFITTDAAVDGASLQNALARVVNRTFNRISVDGDQSCNDTVLLLANGAAAGAVLGEKHPDWPVFEAALENVAMRLAHKIVIDGEGATKFVTVQIRGAASDSDAEKAARAIANSLLVKTSWFGQDPNWGRVIDAAGYSGAIFDPDRVDISYDELAAVRGGMAAPGMTKGALAEVLKRKRFTVDVNLNAGAAETRLFTCDCSHEYVSINSEYTT